MATPAPCSPGTHRPAAPYPFEHAGPLFSPAERSFLGVLEQSVGAELRVLGKGPASRSGPAGGEPGGGAEERRFQQDQPQACGLRALRAAHSLAVVAVVELDDRSHQRADRRERDALVDGVLAAAVSRSSMCPAGKATTWRSCASGYGARSLRVARTQATQVRCVLRPECLLFAMTIFCLMIFCLTIFCLTIFCLTIFCLTIFVVVTSRNRHFRRGVQDVGRLGVLAPSGLDGAACTTRRM